MRKRMLKIALFALSLVSFASLASACSIWGYQPEAPASLRK